MLATNLWSNPSYSAAGSYHAAFLLAGFLFGRRAQPMRGRQLAAVAMAFAVALASWGLWQAVTGSARAHALFETPATFTAVLNLALVPAFAALASTRRNLLLTIASAFIAAGLVTSASRGGWLALASALLVLVVMSRRAGISITRFGAAQVFAALVGGYVLAWVAPMAWHAVSAHGAVAGGAALTAQTSMIGAEAAQSSWARLGMFELALRSALSTNLLTGYGYLGFYYLMEMGRADIATYAAGMTYFVHNDYLQVLLELGIPGLLLLLAIVVWPLVKAYQVAPRASSEEDRVTLVALAAMLASMAVHATVDYPFYIPVCLLIYGMGLGVLDSLLLARGWTRSWRLSMERVPVLLGSAARVAAMMLMASVLLLPVAAEAAAAYAHKNWREGRGQDAAFWFGIARTLQPRDWRYHWYEGQFWFAQAAQQRKPGPAALADKAFAAGVAANPREPRNLVGRLSTQLELAPLLEAPADAGTLMAWADRVVEQAPNDPSATKVRAAIAARLQARERAGR